MIRGLRFTACSLRGWSNLATVPADPILVPDVACKADTNPNKINLTVGAYRDDKGNPFLLESVIKAERMLAEERLDKEYPPLSGHAEFCKAAAILGFGEDSSIIKNSLNCTIQTMSGAGGVRIGAEFLMMNWKGNRDMWIPNLTWPCHPEIFQSSGLSLKTYQYYDKRSNGLNFDGMMRDFQKMKERSMVLLHPCGHNPTGVDPSIEQWRSMLDVLSRKQCCLMFDMAYQGYVSGDPDLDAASVRLMARNWSPKDSPFLLVQSFSKNMGLYGERAATLSIVCESQEEKERVLSNLLYIARYLYSFCPINGARIAAKILTNPELRALWAGELKGMAERIRHIRRSAVRKLAEAGSQRDWSHIEKQVGMFCYTGLNEKEVQMLSDEHSVYMLSTGRMSVSGLNTENVDYFVNAVHEVTK